MDKVGVKVGGSRSGVKVGSKLWSRSGQGRGQCQGFKVRGRGQGLGGWGQMVGRV